MKVEDVARKRKSKLEYLNDRETRVLIKELYSYFDSMGDVPRIKVGKRQSIETLIYEETLLFDKYLRDERKEWKARIPLLTHTNFKH